MRLALFVDVCRATGGRRARADAASLPPHSPVIAQVAAVKGVFARDPKTPRQADQRQIVRDTKAAVVEEDVVIWAQTQHIAYNIGPIVRSAQRPDVRRLCIGTSSRLQADTANLARIIMESFGSLTNRGVPHYAEQR
jgi:hypothetical protein